MRGSNEVVFAGILIKSARVLCFTVAFVFFHIVLDNLLRLQLIWNVNCPRLEISEGKKILCFPKLLMQKAEIID